MREIRNLAGINIGYSHARRGYYIEDENVFGETALMRMVEAFEMFRSLNMAHTVFYCFKLPFIRISIFQFYVLYRNISHFSHFFETLTLFF